MKCSEKRGSKKECKLREGELILVYKTAVFSSDLIIHVTEQGPLKCLAQKAGVNQAKYCAQQAGNSY
jgi:hypothetical protein